MHETAGGEVTPMGFELSPVPSGNRAVPDSGGSKSGNILAGSGASTPPTTPPATPAPTPAAPADPELAAVVAAWPNLPPAIRVGVLALVKAATPPTVQSRPPSGQGGPTT
jgi:hypothetical protein